MTRDWLMTAAANLLFGAILVGLSALTLVWTLPPR
jgi:hypothetical protein